MTNECAQIIDQLIQERERQGLTQKGLATASKLTQPAIARMESKRTTPTLDTFIKVAGALNCTVSISPDTSK